LGLSLTASRRLSVEDFGRYALARAVVAFGAAFLEGAVITPTLIGGHPSDPRPLANGVSFSFVVTAISATAACVMVALLAGMSVGLGAGALLAAHAAASVAEVPWRVGNQPLRGPGLLAIGRCATIVILLFLPNPSPQRVLALEAAWTIALFALPAGRWLTMQRQADRRLTWHLVRPYLIIAAATLAGGRMDYVMLAWLAESAAVARWEATQRFYQLPFYVLGSIAQVEIIRAKASFAQGPSREAQRLALRGFALAPGLTFGFIGLYPVARLLYGEDLVRSSVFAVLAIGLVVAPTAYLVHAVAIPHLGLAGSGARIAVAAGIVNLVLDVLLIPPFGVLGSSFATTASVSVLGIGALLVLKQRSDSR
jgi:hypothetical protein